jgi:hypothetical protein
LPATTAPRLAKVPVPQWNWSVSPVTTSTFGHVDTELLGGDLREHRVVPLALGADAGDDGDLAAGLHLHAGAFEGADAGALDVADEAGPTAASPGAQPRLLLGDEAR